MSKKFRVGSVLKARCPACHIGPVLGGAFTILPRCPNCDYNFFPEPGFYLGAMCVGFLLTAILTVPPLIVLKVMDVDITILLVFPFIEFLVLGSVVLFYSRILWLHLDYGVTNRLSEKKDGKESPKGRPTGSSGQ